MNLVQLATATVDGFGVVFWSGWLAQCDTRAKKNSFVLSGRKEEQS
jgi:hypothetical protein